MFNDYTTLRCNHNAHIVCVQLEQKNKVIVVQRDTLCFNEISFPNKSLLEMHFVSSHTDNTIQCPGHGNALLWEFDCYKYNITKNIPMKVNYVVMMLAEPNKSDKIYHHICTKHDIVHYMDMEKQKKYFVQNDESDFSIGPVDFNVYSMIKGGEFFNHLVIKHTKKRCDRILIYPESRCPACLRPSNHRFRHASVIEYLKLRSEPGALIHNIDTQMNPVLLNTYENNENNEIV